jgi:hypothetical protein
VALTAFRWPLDPALAAGRDETTLARTLYSTPLRTDPATGTVVPGLCSAWAASHDFRDWRFTCREASSIAAALHRLVRLRTAPGHWLFANATGISATGSTLRVRLRFPWRRFPYALTAVGAAPRSVPGPFRLVNGSPRRVVVRRAGLTVVFRRLDARAGLREFRLGRVDEAQIPLGDVAATRAQLPAAVRMRTLLSLDVVVFRGLEQELRRTYWETADRGDYEQLVPELAGSGAYGLVGRAKADPARFRRAVKAIPSLPRVRVRIGLPADPVLRYGAGILYGQWRDVGLGPQLVTMPPFDGSFLRIAAAYPQEEAVPAELVLRDQAGPQADLLHALGTTQQGGALGRLDAALRDAAVVVPISWVVDARVVSPRLDGWREDVLGNVDYGNVRSRASSRRP